MGSFYFTNGVWETNAHSLTLTLFPSFSPNRLNALKIAKSYQSNELSTKLVSESSDTCLNGCAVPIQHAQHDAEQQRRAAGWKEGGRMSRGVLGGSIFNSVPSGGTKFLTSIQYVRYDNNSISSPFQSLWHVNYKLVVCGGPSVQAGGTQCSCPKPALLSMSSERGTGKTKISQRH